MSHKLIKKIVYTGVIKLKTGLHIGGTNAALNIGGPDKFVVRNPINNIPYIPGSSLKGKMRSLLELQDGNFSVSHNGSAGPSNDLQCVSAKLFGVAGNDIKRPSRVIVRDATLDIESQDFSRTDLPYAESKTEVAIDRLTAKANPRTFERIPAGAEFKFEIILNIFDDGEEDELKAALIRAMKLLQDDYLGGNGSRGYGQIEFLEVKTEERKKEYYLKSIN